MYHVYLRAPKAKKWEYHGTFTRASDVMHAIKLVRECYPDAAVNATRKPPNHDAKCITITNT